MAPRIPPLPFRPLELRANGVWDPVRQTFYPFVASDTTVAGRPGVRYFIHSASVARGVSGIQVAAPVYWRTTVRGALVYIISVTLAEMTLVTDYQTVALSVSNVGILSDAGAAISRVAGDGVVIYAEIPNDAAGDL